MSEKEELKTQLHQQKNEKEELEYKFKQVERILEEEDDRNRLSYRRLEEAWEEYGKYDPELGSILEEERNAIDKFRKDSEAYDEQIHNEFRKKMNDIDRKVESLQKRIQLLEDKEEHEEEEKV